MKTIPSTKILVLSLALSSIFIGCSKEEENKILNRDPFIYEFVQDIKADSLKKNVQWLQDMGTRFALSSDRKLVATKIMDCFIKYGYTNTTLDSFYLQNVYRNVVYSTWQYNVIATIEGTEYPDSICIIGGHYDSIIRDDGAFENAPGANDNASGVAATLEVARVIKKRGFEPSSTIQFIAFGAEELGLYGSYSFANKAAENQKKIKMMLNNDMVAYWPVNQKNMRVNIIDYSNSHGMRIEAERICQLYTTLETNNDLTYSAFSDSYPFFLNGYKALFFITDADDPNYHTTHDLVLNCNFNFCREVTKISCALLVENN